MVYYSP